MIVQSENACNGCFFSSSKCLPLSFAYLWWFDSEFACLCWFWVALFWWRCLLLNICSLILRCFHNLLLFGLLLDDELLLWEYVWICLILTFSSLDACWLPMMVISEGCYCFWVWYLDLLVEVCLNKGLRLQAFSRQVYAGYWVYRLGEKNRLEGLFFRLAFLSFQVWNRLECFNRFVSLLFEGRFVMLVLLLFTSLKQAWGRLAGFRACVMLALVFYSFVVYFFYVVFCLLLNYSDTLCFISLCLKPAHCKSLLLLSLFLSPQQSIFNYLDCPFLKRFLAGKWW